MPSVSPRWAFTSGMCAVHEANSSPCTTNTTVTAIRGQRRTAAGAATVGAAGQAVSDTVHLDPGGLQRRDRGLGCRGVGDDHVNRGQ